MHYPGFKIEVLQVGEGIVEETAKVLEEGSLGLFGQDLKIRGTVAYNEGG